MPTGVGEGDATRRGSPFPSGEGRGETPQRGGPGGGAFLPVPQLPTPEPAAPSLGPSPEGEGGVPTGFGESSLKALVERFDVDKIRRGVMPAWR